MNARIHFATTNAERYLGTLRKHFGHKVPVTHVPASGHIDLPFGQCTLNANEAGLTLVVAADDRTQIDKTIGVIAGQLERFDFRESRDLKWLFPETTDA
jgi:hypothetical protein